MAGISDHSMEQINALVAQKFTQRQAQLRELASTTATRNVAGAAAANAVLYPGTAQAEFMQQAMERAGGPASIGLHPSKLPMLRDGLPTNPMETLLVYATDTNAASMRRLSDFRAKFNVATKIAYAESNAALRAANVGDSAVASRHVTAAQAALQQAAAIGRAAVAEKTGRNPSASSFFSRFQPSLAFAPKRGPTPAADTSAYADYRRADPFYQKPYVFGPFGPSSLGDFAERVTTAIADAGTIAKQIQTTTDQIRTAYAQEVDNGKPQAPPVPPPVQAKPATGSTVLSNPVIFGAVATAGYFLLKIL